MSIVKGAALGAVMFLVFSLVYYYAWFGPLSSKKAIGLEAIQLVIVKNVWYWLAGALMIVLGCIIVAIWPVKVQ